MQEYYYIEDRLEDASQVGIIKKRITLPTLKDNRNVMYSPHPLIGIAADDFDLAIKSVFSLFGDSQFVSTSQWESACKLNNKFYLGMPGGLVSVEGIVENKIMKRLGFALGNYGELIIHDDVISAYPHKFIDRLDWINIYDSTSDRVNGKKDTRWNLLCVKPGLELIFTDITEVPICSRCFYQFPSSKDSWRTVLRKCQSQMTDEAWPVVCLPNNLRYVISKEFVNFLSCVPGVEEFYSFERFSPSDIT